LREVRDPKMRLGAKNEMREINLGYILLVVFAGGEVDR